MNNVMRRTIVGAAVAALTTTVTALPQAEAKTSKPGGKISRTEVLQRGNYWVSRHVPYSMYRTYRDPQGKRYRTDCSGFVAMALHLRTTNVNTESLPAYVNSISWSALRPGDIVGTLGRGTGGSNGHVVIFTGWANKAHTKFKTMEQRGGHGAVRYQRAVKFKVGSKYAKPYRYKNITG